MNSLRGLSLFLASAAGFTPLAQFAPMHCAGRTAVLRCSLEIDEATSRRAVLAGAMGVFLGVGAGPATAGYVTSLGIETTSPKDADVDTDLLKSDAVQKGLTNLKGYKSAAATLKTQFLSDTNAQLIPAIRKDFDFSKVRDDLNLVGTVFDDQTQLTVDRISRSILYDLTELENASRFKKGESERTPKKAANVEKWFGKLDVDLTTLLAYFA